MYENFLKKSCTYFNEYEITSLKGDQISKDGSFYSKGFNDTVYQKIDFVLRNNSWDNPNEIVLFSDADVVFLKPTKQFILENMNDHDMVFQSDLTSFNTGVYAFRNNDKVKKLMETTISISKNHYGEQLALNHALHNSGIICKAFDKRIFNISHYNGGKVWNNEDTIHFPKNIMAFHANFIIGVSNKEKALKMACNRFLKEII